MRSNQPATPTISQDVVLTAPTIRCGSCVAKIERSLTGMPGVTRVRANLTLRRINVTLAQADGALQNVLVELENIGHPSRLIDSADLSAEAKDDTEVALLKAVAVSGFGAMNVMLLSVAVWSGASDATRDSFHLISGMIALPIVLYAARFFFTSAWGALRRASMNMDVPIALAIALASAALDYLEGEASKRPDLAEPAAELRREHGRLESNLLALAAGEQVCTNDQLRVGANSIALRASQAALAAAKGTGYIVGHPAGRWCREALFFLVWSCPQEVMAANLCELA
ncbi:hypothetical protein LCGC14_2217810, partial [marine sediment metagenome]